MGYYKTINDKIRYYNLINIMYIMIKHKKNNDCNFLIPIGYNVQKCLKIIL